jgi:hypothetical protein
MNFADKKTAMRFMYLHPMIVFIAADINKYCWDNFGKKITITSAVRTAQEDKKLGATSTTHREGRAVDLSIKGFDASEIKEIIDVFEKKYRGHGALSAKDLKENLIVYHVGTAPHLHVQLNRNYSLNIDSYILE